MKAGAVYEFAVVVAVSGLVVKDEAMSAVVTEEVEWPS